MYRTDVLKGVGGWSTRTLAEDMDLTWTFYEMGHRVRFIPEAMSYPIEPHDYGFMSKQLKRWSHGYVQNIQQHWRGILHVPYLRMAVAVQLWDATIASTIYLFLLPLAAAIFSPWLLLGYVIDVPAVLVPVLAGAAPRGETWKALTSVPAFFVLRTVNAIFFVKAVWAEVVLKKTFRTYEKGH